MTRTQFRWILGGYLVTVVLSIVVSDLTKPLIPAVVRELQPAFTSQSLPFMVVILLFAVALLSAALLGFVGLFCFWSPARRIFLVAVLLKILASPAAVTWLAKTGWQMIFGELELLLDGVILTLCLVGPAKNLFRKEREESNQASEAIGGQEPPQPQR